MDRSQFTGQILLLLRYPVQDTWSIWQLLVGGFVMGGGIASAVLVPILSRLSGDISIGPASLLIAALLVLVPHTIIQGYVMRAVRSVADGDTRIPPFNDVVGLFRDGLTAFPVIIGYGLIPAVLYGLSTVVPEQIGGALLIITLTMAAVAVFLLPAGLVRFAVTDEITAAFDTGVLHRAVTERQYVTTFLTAILLHVLLIVPQAVVTTVLAVTVVGLLFTPAVLLYQFLVYARLFGALDILHEQ